MWKRAVHENVLLFCQFKEEKKNVKVLFSVLSGTGEFRFNCFIVCDGNVPPPARGGGHS